jgi:geranylgeranyl pyrophosphate synthase
VGGQAADLKYANSDVPFTGDINELQSIHGRKTGALITASLELGGIVAGAANEQLAALTGFGQKLGLAFQITDDLLDVSGAEDSVGKRVAKDADCGKLTFPGLLGVVESQRQAQKLVDGACAMIEIFGSSAEPLRQLAKFVVTRKN